MKHTKKKLTEAIENIENFLKDLLKEELEDDKNKSYDESQIERSKKALESAMKGNGPSVILVGSIAGEDNENLVAVKGTQKQAIALLCAMAHEVLENIDVTPEEFSKVLIEGCKKCKEDK